MIYGLTDADPKVVKGKRDSMHFRQAKPGRAAEKYILSPFPHAYSSAELSVKAEGRG
jgi:hypothetical protein